MALPTARKRVTVIGVGNTLLTDDGVGVRVIEAMRGLSLPDIDLTLVDGGTSPDAFLSLPGGTDRLIIVDALAAGGGPGTIYRLEPETEGQPTGVSLSLHELDVRAALRMLKLAGRPPRETVLIGVEPGSVAVGIGLSPGVEARLSLIVEAVRSEIQR